MISNYNLNDIVEMRKEHPCHLAKTWHIVRMGSDIKIKCDGCGAIIMMPRFEFEKKAKRIVQKAPD